MDSPKALTEAAIESLMFAEDSPPLCQEWVLGSISAIAFVGYNDNFQHVWFILIL